MTNIDKFLKSIGVPSDTIEAINKEPEEGKDLDLAPYVDAFKAQQRDVISNDPDFINPLTKSVTGKERAIIEGKIKKVLSNYISDEDITSLEGLDNYVTKMGEVIENNKNHNADSEELQNKLIESNKIIKELRDVEIPKIQSEAEAKHKQFIINSKLTEKINGHELIVPSNVAKSVIDTSWTNKYNVEIGEDGTLDIKTKENLAVLDKDGTTKLSFDEVMKQTLEENKILKLSNGGEESTQQSQRTEITNNGKRVTGIPHLDKL